MEDFPEKLPCKTVGDGEIRTRERATIQSELNERSCLLHRKTTVKTTTQVIPDHSRTFEKIATGCTNASEVTSDMSNKYCNKIED